MPLCDMATARERLRESALKIPTSRWFRAVGPKTIPAMHRAMARVSGGRFHPGATIIVETTGARTGALRETPLEAVAQPDGGWLVVGSNFAQQHHPAWTWNLLAEPNATVTRNGIVTPVTGTMLAGEERQQAWTQAIAQMPVWRDYTSITDREFRLFRLDPVVDI